MSQAGRLEAELQAVLPPGMFIPESLKLLYRWIEENGYYRHEAGHRIGFLYSRELLDDESDEERYGGTDIDFYAQGNIYLKHWFGHEKKEVLDRLCVFAKTGGDGSMAALWLNPDGIQKIVHLGSGSGSALVCVLAEDMVDFLRLLAIGYDEICWSELYSEPPNSDEEDDFFIHPNTAYQNWVRNTFSVDIPRTALEIVKHPDLMGAKGSEDEFFCWVA